MLRDKDDFTEYQIYQTITGGKGYFHPKDSDLSKSYQRESARLGAIAVQYALAMNDDNDSYNRFSPRVDQSALKAIHALKVACLDLDGGSAYIQPDHVIEDVKAVAQGGARWSVAMSTVGKRMKP